MQPREAQRQPPDWSAHLKQGKEEDLRKKQQRWRSWRWPRRKQQQMLRE